MKIKSIYLWNIWEYIYDSGSEVKLKKRLVWINKLNYHWLDFSAPLHFSFASYQSDCRCVSAWACAASYRCVHGKACHTHYRDAVFHQCVFVYDFAGNCLLETSYCNIRIDNFFRQCEFADEQWASIFAQSPCRSIHIGIDAVPNASSLNDT